MTKSRSIPVAAAPSSKAAIPKATSLKAASLAVKSPKGKTVKSKSEDTFSGIDLARVSDRLRALAHPDRLRLIAILLQEELSVGELAVRVALPQPVVSGHLRILQSRGMLACRRNGKCSHYQVATPALADICTCIRSHFSDCVLAGS